MKNIVLIIVILFFGSISFLNSGCSSPTIPTCNDSILIAPYNIGLKAYYKFASSSTNDFSGNAHNGTIVGSVTPTTNAIGGANCAMLFGGGANDYIKVPSHTDFDFTGSTAVSIVLWYKPLLLSAGTYELLFGRDTVLHCPDTYGQYSLGLYDCRKPVFGFNQISCWDTSTQTIGGCGAINNYYIAQGWQNLIVIYDPTAINPWSIYRNGILSSDQHGPCGPAISLSGDIFIGKGFTGSMDDIKVYNRVLSVGEINFLKSYVSPCCP